MLAALILIPLLAGLAAFAIKPDAPRRLLLVVAAFVHLGLVAATWLRPPAPTLFGWLALDAAGRLFLTLASVLFVAAALHGLQYLARESARTQQAIDRTRFAPPETILTGCLLLFLATMTMVCTSNHLGLFWVAVEATTLASAPLIYFHRNRRSLEAAWKYLLICSIGIALALLGNLLLAVSTTDAAGHQAPLLVSELLAHPPVFHVQWLKAAFIFLLVGYGTKMGLAPLHTWLPDAHSESPSLVSALLSGALLNCAFLGILRAQQVCAVAGQAAFGQGLLVLFGLLSMGFAAVFILQQADYKRLLAYSSVEHMGILALGVGLGGGAVFGSFLHSLNHSLTKAMLFLAAGNILAVYKTKRTAGVRGLSRVLPLTGALWLAGFFAITGSPPFGAFLSEFTILKAALEQGRPWVAGLYLALLALIFAAMARTMLRMAQGAAPESTASASSSGDGAVHAGLRESALAIAPPAVLGLLTLLLGLYVPPFLTTALRQAAHLMGGN